MTGEDKMNRIFVYIGIIAGLLLGEACLLRLKRNRWI